MTEVLFDENGQLNTRLDRRMQYLARKIGGEDWEDLLQETRLEWWADPKPPDHLENTMRNLYRPKQRSREKVSLTMNMVQKKLDIIDQMFPDSHLPIDRMMKLFELTRDQIRAFLALKVNGIGLRRISRETGIGEYTVGLLNEYVREYYEYHADLELRCIGLVGRKGLRQWREGGFEGTACSTTNNIIRQHYVREYVDVERFSRMTGLPEEVIEEVIGLWRQGRSDELVLSHFKNRLIRSVNGNNVEIALTQSRLATLRSIFRDSPISILLTPIPPHEQQHNQLTNTLCTQLLQIDEKKSEKCQNSPKNSGGSRVRTIRELEDLKRLFDDLGISYRESHAKGTAIDTLIIQERCGHCDKPRCIEVYFTNRKPSWCCHSCRTREYGGTDGDKVRMPEFYQEFPNTLAGLLKNLGFSRDNKPETALRAS
jgi:DNA-directed RNA polymerase specialized sigma24 family protein